MRLRLFAALFLISVVSSAFAWPPAVWVGNEFDETFADGFDRPGAAVVAENLEFRVGAAHLLEGGVLEYSLDYSSVDSQWGVREPVFGDGRVEIVDPGGPDSALTITWTLRSLRHHAEDQESTRVVLTLAGSTGRITLENPPTAWEFAGTEIEFDRVAGPAIFWLYGDGWGIVTPMLESGSGSVAWPVILDDAQPLSVRIEGHGFDVDRVRLFAYDVVSESTESFGGLKSRFQD